MLFAKGQMRFNPKWLPNGAVRMGEAMGTQPA